MTPKEKAILILVVAAFSFAAGHYLTPVKVVTETKIVEVERKHEEIDTTKHKETKTVHRKNPDGSEETETTVVEDSTRRKERDTELSKDSSTKTETIRDRSHLTVEALLSAPIKLNSSVAFGGHISYNILGPIRAGAFGFQDGRVGVSLGLDL
jgi:ABC-type oligopeptide transport system ATPase subunit